MNFLKVSFPLSLTMKRLLLSIFILGLALSQPTNAQVIGDEALQKIQDGQVSFLEGEFIVFLADTVSPDFVMQQFAEMGYEISYYGIEPILISLVNSPADSVLERLKKHPRIKRSYFESAPVDSAYFRELLQQQDLTGSDLDQAYNRLIESQTRKEHLFEFDYSVNETMLKAIMGNFRAVAYQILQNYPRSVNVSCEPGYEQELMTTIEELPFVESTALIGVLGN